MTMCDGRDDAYGNGRCIKNTVTIDTDRHKGLGGGAGEALFKGRYLPGGAVRRQQGQRPSGSIGTRRREDASGLPLGERNGIF